jgi:hypothetical protein
VLGILSQISQYPAIDPHASENELLNIA